MMSRKILNLSTIVALSLGLMACGADVESGAGAGQKSSQGDQATTQSGASDAKGSQTAGTKDAGAADADAKTNNDRPSTKDGDSPDDGNDSRGDQDVANPQDSAVAQDLVFLREEEKLARDVYLRLYDQWNLRVFDNIAKSEQTHMDAVKVRLDALGVADPVTDDSVGVFGNEELAHLYAELVEKGLTSKVAALEVGATIEDLDILDIEEMKHRSDDETVLSTYNSLQCGSGNHLRAFVGLLEANGQTYEAQFSTQADLDAILAEPHQQCGSR